MGALNNRELKYAPPLSAQSGRAKSGLILLDPAFRIVGLDRGAAAILDGADRLAAQRHIGLSVPQTILAALRRCPPGEDSSFRIPLQPGGVAYRCSTYQVESHIKSSRILALHLERCQSGPDTLDELSSDYRLTDREQEAFRGIALGLTTKEVAERMNISPNTVKAFLRLIMLKMSVNTRAGITAKLFERHSESVGA
jgi:DNA-binding CsgD family transcriptional regulator